MRGKWNPRCAKASRTRCRRWRKRSPPRCRDALICSIASSTAPRSSARRADADARPTDAPSRAATPTTQSVRSAPVMLRRAVPGRLCGRVAAAPGRLAILHPRTNIASASSPACSSGCCTCCSMCTDEHLVYRRARSEPAGSQHVRRSHLDWIRGPGRPRAPGLHRRNRARSVTGSAHRDRRIRPADRGRPSRASSAPGNQPRRGIAWRCASRCRCWASASAC